MGKKILGLMLALMLLVGGAVMAEEATTVTDGMGREVSFTKTPETVVSLTPANTEILYALGLGDKVVGVDSYSNYPEEATSNTIVGDYSGPNVELITSLKPDVVFAGNSLQQEVIDQLTDLGMTVVCNDPTLYEDIYGGIELIAQVMGVDASEVTGPMRAKEEEIAAKVEGASKVKVYFALSFGEYGDYTCGPNTFVDSMITMAGGENVAADTEVSWPQYSLEQLVSKDPDVILVSGDQSMVDAFTTTETYKELRAVKEGKVFAVDADTSNRPGPRIVEALEQIAKALHPEVFE